MRLRVIATDYDGTVATDGQLHPDVLAAFGRLGSVMQTVKGGVQHSWHFVGRVVAHSSDGSGVATIA